eukprot:777431-Alexandrium_andersonii.AAC.1
MCRIAINVLKFAQPSDDGIEWLVKGQKEAKELMPTLTAQMAVGHGKFVPSKRASGASGPSELGQSEAQGSAAKAKAKAVFEEAEEDAFAFAADP